MPPDINDLGLTEESTPQVDWDAPESGQFPPRFMPGTYDFGFKLPEATDAQFDAQTVDGKKYLQVNWTAVIDPRSVQADNYLGEKDPMPETVDLPFQRTSFYKSASMQISFGADLLRSLGTRLDGSMSPQGIAQVFRQIDGRARGRGDLGWDAYCKTCDQRISTTARTKKGDLPWPKGANGRYELQATCKCGARFYGREQFVRFKLPQGA